MLKFVLLGMLLLPELSTAQVTGANPYTPCQIDSEEKLETIKSVIDSYQNEIQIRHHQLAEFILMETTDCRFLQATGGHNKEEEIAITFSPALINQFSVNALVFTICHELGHVLGSVTPADAGTTSRYNPKDSIEGEADYFGGACARSFLGSHKLVEAAAREALERIYGIDGQINPGKAIKKKYRKGNGINPDYPDANCRLLTAIRGSLGEPRPKCWYNPKR